MGRLDRAGAAVANALRVLPAAGGPGDFATGPRWERMIEHIHSLGPRAVAELLAEIAAVTGQHVRVVDLVEEYAQLDPAVLRAIGRDQFPPMALELVR